METQKSDKPGRPWNPWMKKPIKILC
jgi:hypothetical protein